MYLNDHLKNQFRKELKKIRDDYHKDADFDAFPIWICKNFLDINDSEEIEEAISIAGSGDYDIDIFHINHDGEDDDKYICWAQVKYAKDLNRKINRQELVDFCETINYLKKGSINANEIFKMKSKEFNDIGGVNSTKYRKKMIFAVTGELNDQAKSLIDDPTWRSEKFSHESGPNIEFEIIDLQKILKQLTSPSLGSVSLQFASEPIKRTDPTNNKKSICGYVSTKDIRNIVKKYNHVLFSENPRQSLGKTETNEAIKRTLNDSIRRKQFWKFNNGITAVCEGFNDDDPTHAHKFNINNLKVVNGRQTTAALTKFSEDLDDVFVFMTIHEIDDDAERDLISHSTNLQNP